MNAQEIHRLRRIEALFDGALDYPAGPERDAWLREQCPNDEGVVAEARRLLDRRENIRAIAPAAAETLPQFGPWRAIRLLGRGGMGMVYLAERSDGAFQMTVAVKVVPLALASLDIEERFRRERQFLARLDHPKIARLLDGGVTSAGLPYLVMDFVDGQAIDRYCDAGRLDTKARIGLMRQVLEALTYVHGRQVIHRDLKASNILVDAAGNAKLLDFGTARLVDASGDAAITKSGVFAFTPECASPEQVQGKPLTFATDIYSAGVLLKRLLTGVDAPLDAILSKALRENPEERYASAEEMDADLARYLEGQPVEARRPRRWKWMAVAAAGLALGGAAAWLLHKPQAPVPPSIAVLPFANVGNNPANQYFSDGLTGEITDALTHLKGLRVIARSSAFQFRGKENDLRNIGRQLNVTHVVEGSVERAGDQVKIVARLDRVSDLSQIWSSHYERKDSDLFSVQAEVAAGIATRLGTPAPVSKPARHIVQDAEARDAYMRGYFEMQKWTPASCDQAESDFKHAIARDPQYALAYANLGNVIWNRAAIATVSGGRTAAIRAVTEQLYRKTLELDPGNATTRSNLAMMVLQYDWDWGRAERELEAALANGPDQGADSVYAFLLIIHGRFADAEEHLLRSQTLNPLGSVRIIGKAMSRDLEGRFEDARAEWQRALSLHPDTLLARVGIDVVDIEEGQTERALADLKALEPRSPLAPLYEAMALARAGRRDEALRLIRPLEERPIDETLYLLAMVYADLGDEANTMKWLERSADRREYGVLTIGVAPAFALLRDNSRFRALKKRIGLER